MNTNPRHKLVMDTKNNRFYIDTLPDLADDNLRILALNSRMNLHFMKMSSYKTSTIRKKDSTKDVDYRKVTSGLSKLLQIKRKKRLAKRELVS